MRALFGLLVMVVVGAVILALASTASAGERRYHSSDRFTFVIPYGWVEIDRITLAENVREAGRLTGVSSEYEAGFQAVAGEDGTIEYPYLLVGYVEDVTISLNEFAEGIGELLKGAATQASWGGLLSDVQPGRAVVDRERDQVIMSFEAEFLEQERVRTIAVNCFGRAGVASILVYVDPDDYATYAGMIQGIADSLSFDEGHEYGRRGLAGFVKSPVVIVAGLLILAVGTAILLLRRRRGDARTAPTEVFAAGPAIAVDSLTPSSSGNSRGSSSRWLADYRSLKPGEATDLPEDRVIEAIAQASAREQWCKQQHAWYGPVSACLSVILALGGVGLLVLGATAWATGRFSSPYTPYFWSLVGGLALLALLERQCEEFAYRVAPPRWLLDEQRAKVRELRATLPRTRTDAGKHPVGSSTAVAHESAALGRPSYTKRVSPVKL